MKLLGTISILTGCTFPVIGLGAGPTPPEPGDLPIGVLTATGDTLVDMPGGGVYAVVGERTYYSPADGSPTIDCDASPAECLKALQEDENPPEDPPSTPPAEDPPEDPPKKPKKGREGSSTSRVDPSGCDSYARSEHGEACMVVETRYESGAPGNGFFLSCPTDVACFFADFFHYSDGNVEQEADDVDVLRLGMEVTAALSR